MVLDIIAAERVGRFKVVQVTPRKVGLVGGVQMPVGVVVENVIFIAAKHNK